jgi:asparagine synthase (glutamine-hydrolysing)
MLVRDRFGVKPLYYSQIDNKIIFSSEIRPIQEIMRSNIFLDGLSVLLQLRYIPAPYTLYKDIMKLRPGHYAKIELKNITPNLEVFQYDKPVLFRSNISFNEAVDLYGEYFEKAIKRQLMSDVDIGIFLSGGVDSALVASVANKVSPRKLKSFTVGFNSNYNFDEIKRASETAKYLNIEHEFIQIGANNFFEIFEECSKIIEEPLATTSVIPMYYLSKLAAKKVKVVLTGQGADEPLGGYKRYQGELIREKYPGIFIKLFSTFVKIAKIKNEQLVRGANSLTINNEIERFLSIYSVFMPDEIENLIGQKCVLSGDLLTYFYNNLNCKEKDNSVSRMMAVDMRMNLSDDLLLYTDKITMNFSLECRVPVLDYELIQFLDSLPLHYKMTGKETKIIHKAYAEKVLPKEIISRAKLGFQSPTDIWFRDHMNRIKELLLFSGSPLLLYFNSKFIERLLNEHSKGFNHEKKIFLLLSIYYWLIKSK